MTVASRATLFLLSLVGGALAACGPAHSDVTSPTGAVPVVMHAGLPASHWYRAGASNEGALVGPDRVVLLLGERARVGADGSVTPAAVKSPERLMRLVVLEEDGKTVLFGASYKAIYRFDQPLGAGMLLAKSGHIGGFGAASGRLCIREGQSSRWLDGHGREAAPPPGITSCPTSLGLASATGPEPALVSWLRRTHWAPLEAAAMGGVEAGSGRAFIVGGGLAMVVDLTTGLPLESVEVAMPVEAAMRPVPWRGVSFDKRVAFINADEEPADLLGGGLLLRPAPRWLVEIERPYSGKAHALVSSPPSVAAGVFDQDAWMYASGSGALVVSGACPADAAHSAHSRPTTVCVRQPDGSFRTYLLPWSEDEPTSGIGSTADGSLLVARWQKGTLHFERIDKNGASYPLAAVPNVPEGAARLLDEDEVGNVHALVRYADRQGVVSIRVDPTGHVSLTPFDTAHVGAAYRGRVVVRDEEALHISTNSGGSWERVEAPSAMAGLRVSEVGFAVPGHYFRIGWGPQDKLPPGLSLVLTALPSALSHE